MTLAIAHCTVGRGRSFTRHAADGDLPAATAIADSVVPAFSIADLTSGHGQSWQMVSNFQPLVISFPTGKRYAGSCVLGKQEDASCAGGCVLGAPVNGRGRCLALMTGGETD